jgi:heat shock protein HslJ
MGKIVRNLQVWHVAVFLGLAVTGFFLIFIKTHIRPEPVFVFPHASPVANGMINEPHENSDVIILSEIVGSSYRLISVDGVVVPETSNYKLVFGTSELAGSICNTFQGYYDIRGERLTSSVSATKMYCPDDRSNIEMVLFDALGRGVPVILTDNTLILVAGGIEYKYEEIQ